MNLLIDTDEFDLEQHKNKFMKMMHKNRKIRMEKRWEKRLTIVAAGLLIVTAGMAGYRFYRYSIETHKNQAIYEKALAALQNTPAPTYTPMSSSAPEDDIIFTEAPVLADEAETTAEPEPAATPEPEEPKVLLEKIQKLRETFTNDDIVGFLSIIGADVDLPVAQSEDNEYYLKHDLNGEINAAGTVFMDYECDAYELSRHTVIYGHNMRNGSMFHHLRYYNDPDYWRAHPIISLTTPYEETTWEIFAVYQTSTDFYYIQVLFPHDEAFNALVSEMKKKSIYETGVAVDEEDYILTLSTCSAGVADTRMVVSAKRMEG